MGFSMEELAAMAAADDAIERSFSGVTEEEMELAGRMDAIAAPKKVYRADTRRRYYLRHRERILAKDKAYRMEHRDRIAEYDRIRYRRQKDEYLARSRKHRERMVRERPTEAFGQRIRAARKRAGLSARQLAELLGVTDNLVYDSEYGIRVKPDERLAAWLEKEEENNVRMDRIPDA